MPLSICAMTPLGFAANPQSIAHHTLCTRTLPPSTDTSATLGDDAAEGFLQRDAAPAARRRTAGPVARSPRPR